MPVSVENGRVPRESKRGGNLLYSFLSVHSRESEKENDHGGG